MKSKIHLLKKLFTKLKANKNKPFLIIELEHANAAPKIVYEGESLEYLKMIDFSYITQGEKNSVTGLDVEFYKQEDSNSKDIKCSKKGFRTGQ